MRTLFGIITTLPWLVLLGACATNYPAGVKDNQNSLLKQGRIQFGGSTMPALIRIERMDPQRVGRGLLRVVLTMRNKTKKNLWVECRTTFLDERKHVLEQTNWEMVLLDARTLSEYTCTSLSKKAADYQVILRKPAERSLKMP